MTPSIKDPTKKACQLYHAPKANSWFRFYLVNRTQICRVEGALSEASVLSFEVPQGTTISPNVIPFICR